MSPDVPPACRHRLSPPLIERRRNRVPPVIEHGNQTVLQQVPLAPDRDQNRDFMRGAI